MTSTASPAPGTSASAQRDMLALFASDVHLQESMPQTAAAFLQFLDLQATQAQQLYLLGDLFEYWAGDDDLDTPFHRRIVTALRAVSEAGTRIFWIGGNRDFLVAGGFASAAGLTLLPDPSVVTVAGQRITITHGDAQCTDDTAYMVFRRTVRDTAWQQTFLATPLEQRKAIIAGMRRDSRNAQQTKSYDIMDVNADSIASLFDETDTRILIHGHTHRPAVHVDPERQRTRYVLPDWDCDIEHVRGGWIAVDNGGAIRRYDVHGMELVG